MWERRITSYNVCYTKLLRIEEGAYVVMYPYKVEEGETVNAELE